LGAFHLTKLSGKFGWNRLEISFGKKLRLQWMKKIMLVGSYDEEDLELVHGNRGHENPFGTFQPGKQD